MLIKVRYDNGRLGTVPSSSLDYYIARKEITAFCRSDGWATIGVDPIRTQRETVKREAAADHARRESDGTGYYG